MVVAVMATMTLATLTLSASQKLSKKDNIINEVSPKALSIIF